MFGGLVARSLGHYRASLLVFWLWFGSHCAAWMALRQSVPSTDAESVGPVNAYEAGGSSCGLLSWWCPGSGDLATPEGLDDAHLSTTVGTWLAQCEGWWRFF